MEDILEDIIIGRIYMIYNTKTPMIYIGSTTLALSTRWAQHMCSIKRNTKLYDHMCEIGTDYFRIKLLEWKQVKHETELRQLEQQHLDMYNKDILLNNADAYVDKEKQLKKKYDRKRKNELADKMFELDLNKVNDSDQEI